MMLLRDRGDDLAAADIRPFGISRDSPWSHVSWSTTLGVDNVPLLSDWNGDATHGFDVAFEHRGLRNVSARSAFLIGGDGVVRGAWRYETSELPDFDVLLASARAL